MTETLNGLATIRAYGSQDRFVERNETLVDNNVRAFVTLFIGNQWLGIRLDLLGFVFFLITTLIMAYNRLTIDPGASFASLLLPLTDGSLIFFVCVVWGNKT